LSRNNKPKIIWAPTPCINIHYNSLADRKRGYQSSSLVYICDQITRSQKFFDYDLSRWLAAHGLNRKIAMWIGPIIVFPWATLKYDIFHFYYDGGLLKNHFLLKWLEFPLLKLAGKKIIFSAFGSDVRLENTTRKLGKYHAYLDFDHQEIEEKYGSDKKIRQMVGYCLRYANAALSMGDMTEYTPNSINNTFYWPLDPSKITPVYESGNPKVRIIHSTHHPRYKGTRFLLETLDRLRREGCDFEYVYVTDVGNEEARRLYATADIFAEQFIIGWHGFTAVEMMALGKPVLCYIRKKEYLPNWTKCPIVNTNPDNLYENLKTLIENKELRLELGRKGREYVEEVFSLEKFGERMEVIYKDIWK
jgi:hypothetical protein